MSQTVVVVGATPNPERYAYRAMRALLHHGYHPIPVHPTAEEVLGVHCRRTLSDVTETIDTITLYIGPDRLAPLIESILAAKPRRILMNPGAESEELAAAAQTAGILVVRGCTLVMLQDGTF